MAMTLQTVVVPASGPAALTAGMELMTRTTTKTMAKG